VSHPYLSFYANVNGDMILASNSFMQDASILNSGIEDEKMLYEVFGKLQEIRTADIEFVIDTVLANAGSGADEVYRMIDTSKIGLFGHSMGGATVTAVGGQRGGIGAVVNLDAPLFGELLGFQDGKMILRNDVYPEALLNIYSDDLWGLMEGDPLYAGNVRLLTDTPPDVYNVHFDGAKHMSFTDLPLFSPLISNALQGGKANIDKYYCIETMNGVILKFFDRYLKGGGAFTPLETY
jgi:hypothetical protein